MDNKIPYFEFLFPPGGGSSYYGGLLIPGRVYLRAELVPAAHTAGWAADCQTRWESIARRLSAVLTPRAPPPHVEKPSDVRVLERELDELGGGTSVTSGSPTP